MFWRRFCVFACVLALCLSSWCVASGDMDALPVDGNVFEGTEDLDITTYSTLSPITPTNTNGLVSVVLSVIGDYNPIVAEHRYQNTNGTYSYVREIQPDYTWLVSAAIFMLVLYCVFRLWGGIFCRT